ncbi:SPOR domain-containing protein [Saccharospirillum impatiens]|uniref:SPOR domain-containing protein n=1 Tax=Saccharospirillum impatiens TaxID=169438 RepID=UPI0003F99845|nr:SPOR domain-containing protein [Saccharospirillum impatiens]
MKWIILTLLVLNLALGGYQYWQMGQPDIQEAEPSVAQLNNLAIDQATRNQLAEFEQTAAAEPAVEPLQCIRINGIAAEDQADIIQSRLRALEVASDLSTRQEVLRSDYWVVIGPFETDQLGRDRLAQLQAEDIESFLINQGRLAGGISLGLFSSDSNARTRVSELTSRGLEARVERVDRTRNVWVLTVPAESARQISNAALDSIVSEFEGASFQRFRC